MKRVRAKIRKINPMINGEIHVHAPQSSVKGSHRTVCIDCGKKTVMLGFFTEWYGWDTTCIKCGRNWIDGEWMALDFVRQSRQISIAAAKKRWRSMPKDIEK